MITFDNFQHKPNHKIIDITIPNKAIVHINTTALPANFLYQPAHSGQILYNEIPIIFCKKSFLKKIYCEININNMFEENLTLEENLKIYAEIYGSFLIKNAPCKYFEIPLNILKEKVKNIQKHIVNLAEIGLLFYCRSKVCFIESITEELAKNEKVCHLVTTRVNNGNDTIIHTGYKMAIEEIIELEL